MIGPTDLPSVNHWHACDVEDFAYADGDTVTLHIDMDFAHHAEHPLRCLGVNAPERNTPEGKVATDWTRTWVNVHRAHGNAARWPFLVQYSGWDKYAPRFDGVLVCGQNHCWNDDLIASGNAVAKVY